MADALDELSRVYLQKVLFSNRSLAKLSIVFLRLFSGVIFQRKMSELQILSVIKATGRKR